MAVASLVILLLAVASSQAPRDPARPGSDIIARLSAFEKQAAAGKVDPGQLGAIAGTVLGQAAESTDRAVAVEACGSAYAPNRPRCAERLWAIARQAGGSMEGRIGAASALARLGEKGASDALYDLARTVPPAQLAPVADQLRPLPSDKGLPLMISMLESGNAAAEVAACRLLGDVNAGESQAALQRFLTAAPRGTGAWQTCTLAAARAGDPEAQRAINAIVNAASDQDLIQAGQFIAASDPERGADILMLATRKTTGIHQIHAAEKLAALRPDIAERIVEGGLGSDRPDVRAAALAAHRALQSDPDARVRRMLVDRDPIVRVRAAETILAWAAQRKPGPAGGAENALQAVD